MKHTKITFSLDNSSIDKILQNIQAQLDAMNMEQRNAQHLCISIEELLLRWQDHFGPEQSAELEFSSRFGQRHMYIRTAGLPCNPLEQAEDSLNWGSRILENLGLVPAYSYRKGLNVVDLKLQHQKGSSTKTLLLSIAAAIVFGTAGVLLMPEQAAHIAEHLLQPIRSAMMGLLIAAAVPMIFLSILMSVCGVGDITVFSNIGGKMIRRFILISFLVILVATLLYFPFFSLNMAGGTVETEQLGAALQMLLDILPGNLFEPFITGNTLQLIVIAAACGTAFLILGERAAAFRRLAEDLYSVLFLFLSWIGRLIPAIVFLMLLEMLWSGNYQALLSIWKPMLVTAVASTLLALGYLLFSSRKKGVPLSKLLRKISPVLLIVFATASAAAAYSTNSDCCKEELGLDERIVGLGLPVGQSIFNPTLGLWYLACVFYGAERYGVECSLAWLFVAWFCATLFSFSTPPVPGGCIACYSILLSQMGIPAEALASIIAMDFIMDRIHSGMRMPVLQMDLLLFADKVNLLDKDRLRS